MTIYPNLRSVFVAVPGLTVYIPYPKPIVTRSINSESNHFVAKDGIMWDTELTLYRDPFPHHMNVTGKVYVYNAMILESWLLSKEIPPKAVLKLIVKLPDRYSAELAAPEPPVLVAVLSKVKTLSNPIRITASTRYNSVTFTNDAYRQLD
jgi:hypothetical protein